MGPVSTKDTYLYNMANDEAHRKGPKTPSRCNIVECYMLHPFSHLFRVIGSCCAKFEACQTFAPAIANISPVYDRQGLFPLRKRSLPFLTVDATIGKRALSYDRCNIFTELNYNMANNTFLNSVIYNKFRKLPSLLVASLFLYLA